VIQETEDVIFWCLGIAHVGSGTGELLPPCRVNLFPFQDGASQFMTIPSYRSIDIEPNDDDSSQNFDDSLLEDDDDDVVASDRRRPPLHRSNSIPRHQRVSATAAALALMKGNLGPGILNLPHAFARAGPSLSVVLFLLVSLQGLYSMTLLVACKNWIVHASHRGEGAPSQASVQTFMDVTQFALGNVGGRLTELFVFVLQLGVCCVFISLIATNLQAAFGWLSSMAAISCIALAMMGVVLLRFIKDLFWLNAIANTFMLMAILTATIASLVNIHRGLNQAADASSTTTHGTLSAGVSFTADMFFAFEGIGLVLPVENNYDHPSSHSAGSTKRWQFSTVLLVSMSGVAMLFALTGLTASIGFPDIASASVTAYLKQTYPQVLWFSMVNFLVLIAVALTFPLQLTPAMEVLEKWLTEIPQVGSLWKCGRPCTFHRSSSDDNAVSPSASLEEELHNHASRSGHTATTRTTVMTSIWNQYSWVVRRWMVVLSCAAFVYLVDDLGILVSLFGAVGQTGLAGMPCAVHLVLQRRHVAPKNVVRSVIDVLIIVFCTLVMISGCYLSVLEIMHKNR
jgi:amino acid permease